MKNRPSLTHQEAHTLLNVILDKLEEQQKGAAIAIADEHGELLAFIRTDGCPLPSIYNATYYGELRYTGWGGGMPLKAGGVVVGAIGVSGLPEEEDMVLAQHGVDYFNEKIAH